MERFWEEFEAYVRSYLPQWHYRRGGPELEAALMTVLGELLEESRSRLDHLPEIHGWEFLAPWLGELQAGAPAYAYAALRAPRRTAVPKGSAFYRSGDGTRVWETVEDSWAESLCLSDMVLAGGKSGKLIPLPPPGEAVTLFDFRLPGAQVREVRFCHPDVYSSQTGCSVSLELENASDRLLRCLQDPEGTEWSLLSGESPVSLPAPRRSGNALLFSLPPAPGAAALSVRVRDGFVPPPDPIRRAAAHVSRGPSPQVWTTAEPGTGQGDAWLPFGERLSPWSMCCIACPDALCLPGSEVTFSWAQSFALRKEGLPGPEREPAYKPVMRRMPPAPPEVRDLRAERVLWEYWDGAAWRSIPGTEPYTRLFSDADAPEGGTARLEARFPWPGDAAPCEIQGRTAHWLRWRLCAGGEDAWLPVVHHAPEVSDMRVSAELRGAVLTLRRRCGLEAGFTEPAGEDKVLFPPLTPDKDTWWLGFDGPPGGGAVRLYLALRGRAPGGALSAWEALPEGGEARRPLLDGTGGLAHSCVLSLETIRGDKSVRFGLERWWISLRDESGAIHAAGRAPVLQGLSCGAALLRSVGRDVCAPGDPFLPLRGGGVSGAALTEHFGGAPEETEAERLRRVREERHHLGRAVSALDVDQLVRGAVRSVLRTRCVSMDGAVHVGVLMRDAAHHAEAFALERERIRRVLTEAGAFSPLGLSVHVREPCFYPIHVMAWIRVPSGDGFAGSSRRLERALSRFLDPAAGGFQGFGWPLGHLPDGAQLRSCLLAAAPGVTLTELVSAAVTPEGWERETASIRDPFALPIPGTCTIHELKGGASA